VVYISLSPVFAFKFNNVEYKKNYFTVDTTKRVSLDSIVRKGKIFLDNPRNAAKTASVSSLLSIFSLITLYTFNFLPFSLIVFPGLAIVFGFIGFFLGRKAKKKLTKDQKKFTSFSIYYGYFMMALIYFILAITGALAYVFGVPSD
jgi:magnesium-transporting ATPase (P-type)